MSSGPSSTVGFLGLAGPLRSLMPFCFSDFEVSVYSCLSCPSDISVSNIFFSPQAPLQPMRDPSLQHPPPSPCRLYPLFSLPFWASSGLLWLQLNAPMLTTPQPEGSGDGNRLQPCWPHSAGLSAAALLPRPAGRETDAGRCFSADGLSSPAAQPRPLDLGFLSLGCLEHSFCSLLLLHSLRIGR